MPVPTRRLLGALIAGLPLALAAGFAPAWAPVWLVAMLLLLLAALVDWLFRPRAADVTLAWDPPPRLALGRESIWRLRVGLQRGASVSLRLRLDLPFELEGATDFGPVRLRAGESQPFDVRLLPRERGSYGLGAVHLRWRGLLGLWEYGQRHEPQQRAVVRPDFEVGAAALKQIDMLAADGNRTLRRRGEGSELDSLREYRPGDEPNRIDWKATARRGKPVCRQFRVERNHDLVIAVNAGRLMGARFHGAAKFEHVLRAALALAEAGIRAGDRVGFLAFDQRVRTFVPPAKGAGQVGRILDAALDLRATSAETSFREALVQLGVHQRKRSLVVLFTDFIDGHTAKPMLEALFALSKRHAFLFVAVGDPTLEEALREPPAASRDLFAKVAAYGLRGERRLVLEQVRQMGVRLVDEMPDRLAAPVLDAYLDMRGAGVL